MNAEPTHLALEWLAYALGDLEAARSRKGRHVRPRHVANLAQQAAEKALKAALVLEGLKPPPKHDLDDLRARLPGTWRVKRHPKDLSRLTDYGVDVKYPDSSIQVTPLQAAVAVRQAIAVISSSPPRLRAPRRPSRWAQARMIDERAVSDG